MQHPRLGERVFVRPTNPSIRVQRGEGLYGQFLAPEGQECLWDDFLHRRLTEGAITWSALQEPPPVPAQPAAPVADPELPPAAPDEPEPAPTDKENG